ncbi:MAG: efflux RND transporter permease subunit, partial [Anaerolineae bacterium]
MGGIAGFAPELLNDLTPDMWLALDPTAVSLVLADVSETLDAQLVAELQALQFAADGQTPEPVKLPESWVTMAAGAGFTLETTADVPAAAMEQLVGFAPQLLDDLTPEMVLAFAPDVQAALPEDYVVTLDAGLQQTLANITVYAAQLEMAAATGGEELPGMEPVALPETWIAGAAQLGQEIATTADVTPEIMGALVNFAPEQLNELTPETWRALSPEALALALPAAGDSLDAELAAQLEAITLAANGQTPEPAALPESWVTMASSAGFTLATTADVPAAAMEQLVGFAPQLLADLTPEVLLAFPPDVLAGLPEDYVATLDAGLQQTLTAVAVADAGYQASLVADAGGDVTEVEEPEVDPARLPDMLIQGAKAFGADIEFAQDLTPDLIRPLAAAGPQAAQFFQMLTPDHLRLMPAESIALMPMDFLDSLDADLRAELDELAAEFGGAGQLAVKEAEERAAESANAPALSGIWLEPGPNGEEPLFKTAADLLNNPFTPSAAMLLNSLPTQSERPADLAGDLTAEVVAYLAENEEGFVSNLERPFLELMSPETLSFMLETYPDAFDAETTDYLTGIVAGTVAVFVPEASITRTDGDPAVIVSLFKDGDANTVEVAHRIFDAFDEFTAANPQVKTSLVFEQATFIEDSIRGVSREGALGAVFAVVVILLFLSGHVGGKYKLSWRATVVTGVSIPLSVFTSFLLMRWLPPTMGEWIHSLADSSGNGTIAFFAQLFPKHVTLNIMTLSGLTVAIGRVVDDSIVVLEN